MSLIQKSAIKEIAREIALGNTCYIDRYSSEVTTIDHGIEDAEQLAAQAQTQAELERKIDNYVKIAKLTAAEQMVIMKDFLDEQPDRSVHKQLTNALSRKNPVRNFMQAVESDMALSQHWQNFNLSEYQRWVSDLIIEAYNY